jgi:hypothetical protein
MAKESVVENEPITLSGALTGVLVTGVALVAIFMPDLSQAAQVAIVGFGNAVIVLGAIIYARSRSTPISNPVLAQGTEVTVVTPVGEPNEKVTL